MTRTPRPTLALRTAALLTVCGLSCWVTWALVRDPMLLAATPLLERSSGGLGQVPLETAVVGGCAVLLLVCVLWAVGLTTLSVAAQLVRELAPPGSHRTARLAKEVERRCPAMVRRLTAAMLGVTIGAGLAVPALGAIDPPAAPAPLSDLRAGQLSGLALPDRATGAGLAIAARPAMARRAASHTRGTHPRRPRFVDVRPGDSLWRIAQTLLRRGASDVELTRAWHRIHRLNSERIGADPDLIRPGTLLALPSLLPAHRKDSP